jgi:AcrR family transcriptional regulator
MISFVKLLGLNKGIAGEAGLVIQDRRIRRTQQLLAKALISLTLEKGYEAVTIRDITTRADVGYATFFRHYKDKNELLQDVVDVMLEELIALLLPKVSDADSEEVGVLLFQYVQTHNEVVRIMLSSHEVLQRVVNVATENLVNTHNAPPDSLVPLEIAAYHIVSSSIALTEWWLAHQMPYSPEKMGRIYRELIMRPTNLLLSNPR